MAIEKAPKHGGRETLTAIGDQAFLYFQQRHVRPPANETVQIVAMGLYTTRTKQLIVETRAPIACQPEQPARHDYEYERNGVANTKSLKSEPMSPLPRSD